MKIFTSSYLLQLVLTLLGLLALPLAPAAAQNYQLPTNGLASYTTCSGTLYDDGGPQDPYDARASGSVTLRPGTPGSKLKLNFAFLELDSLRSRLAVYDGTNTSAPLIGQFHSGRPTVYATSSTGALTIVLTSQGGLALRGFAATISCATGPPPPPDLAVQHLEARSTRGLAGDAIATTARLANLSGALITSEFSYLLSTDNQASVDDVLLRKTFYALAAGTAVDDRQELQLPAGTAPGSYSLLCVARLTGPQIETKEANNVAATPFSVLAPTPTVDLAIAAVSYPVPTLLAAGSTIVTNTWVQNLGRSLAVASQIGYYLSADSVLSADDTLLGSTAPTAGNNYVVGSSNILPTSTVPGSYYLLCVADYLDQVIEDEESNNVFAQPMVVGPASVDVAFDSYWNLTPTQLTAGGSANMRCYLLNWGSARTDSASVGYYLSADRLLSADDVLLAQASAGPLLPGNYYLGYAERTLTIAAGTPPGKRYLLLVADHRQQLAESDETNNVLSLSLEIMVPDADLLVSSASAYYPVVGNKFVANYTLTNRGTTTAYPALVGCYLSTDNQLSTNDIFLGQGQAEPLAGGTT